MQKGNLLECEVGIFDFTFSAVRVVERTKATVAVVTCRCGNSTGRFIMFSVITNIYNKKTKGPTLMELFTATGKVKKSFSFGQLETFDVCTTGDTANIDTIFKFLSHTRQHGCIDILHCFIAHL
jgi:hypothetical protein